MKRREFLGIAAGTIAIAGGIYYAFSDKSNFVRADLLPESIVQTQLARDERHILYLSSLAPSGHNTQPWLIKYIEPFHWIICNDKTKWLPAVDPTQRETMLSIGAFIQNLEYAAHSLGYSCLFSLVAKTNQDVKVMEVKLTKTGHEFRYDTKSIIERRTIRSNILPEVFKAKDIRLLIDNEPDLVHYIPSKTKVYQYINEQTIEANKVQSYRNAAQKELADWIRFSNKEAEKYLDGLTPGSMEIAGISGWVVRNFYGKSNVMDDGFRDQSIKQVEQQVASSAGWFLITSKDESVINLIQTGMRMQRLFLKVKDQNIAIHPMTQILEEPSIHQHFNASIGINDPVQFILRTGYVNEYPDPVSLRRPVEWLINL